MPQGVFAESLLDVAGRCRLRMGLAMCYEGPARRGLGSESGRVGDSAGGERRPHGGCLGQPDPLLGAIMGLRPPPVFADPDCTRWGANCAQTGRCSGAGTGRIGTGLHEMKGGHPAPSRLDQRDAICGYSHGLMLQGRDK